MSIRDAIRELLERLRERRRTALDRDVDAAEDARRHGSDPGDPSEGALHPAHDPSSWGGAV
jgi:Arc/MetJ-type ribon-helix-helix transcriptional regulator